MAASAPLLTHTADRQTIPAQNAPESRPRPTARGKFLFDGARKLWIKGVTYGTFRPDGAGVQFPSLAVVEHDLAAMAAHGFNCVRTYTVPPVWLLDAAHRHGLRVMVGLPWAQHVAFLDEPALAAETEAAIRDGVVACAGHPAVLCYALGNEIPPSIVRWHGALKIERFVERLYRIGKAADPDGLFTYVNYPSTEYLQLPFLDLVCFNVYLERRDAFERYLARLQNIAGDKPLVMAEIGLDSRRNGVATQATSLAWQIDAAFRSGCAGAFAYAWTDEWHRGGHDIEDWDFGLTTRERKPKPALLAVQRQFNAVPFAADLPWPKVSVVVCSYNGSATIRDTLNALAALDYPDYEVIVVNDGSTDAVPEIASEYDVKLISTENRGLSSARNTGWQEAKGEIVAYIDDDAYPDPHWLRYVAHTLMTTDYVGVGGPNIPPPEDGPIADCVANAPGGPVHVLVTDTEAEHIPGCNMAFRRDALRAIDGFDPRYRTAGDDVDVCWRLQERGWKIGFNGAAVVWHHRRNSLRQYWRQQQGYGKAEALLEQKWPEKYNSLGHLRWAGRLYGKGLAIGFTPKQRIYHGQLGAALFQSIYSPAPSLLQSLPLMPEWYLATAILGALSLLGAVVAPFMWAVPLLILSLALPLIQAVRGGARARFATRPLTTGRILKLRCLTTLLHLAQPMARLKGRLQHGLSPGRQRAQLRRQHLRWRLSLWSERHRSADDWIQRVETRLRASKVPAVRAGDFSRWDLMVGGGALGSARMKMAIEEHGQGRQLLRFSIRPGVSRWALFVFSMAYGLAAIAFSAASPWVGAVLVLIGSTLVGYAALQTAAAVSEIAHAVSCIDSQNEIGRNQKRVE